VGKFVAGDIVVINFPFSNLAGGKPRPALVVSPSGENDYILCQITSKSYGSQNSVQITENDLTQGILPVISYIRPDKLFTADNTLIKKKIAKISTGKLAAFKTSLALALGLN
jgi:mRNA interferase MazF